MCLSKRRKRSLGMHLPGSLRELRARNGRIRRSIGAHLDTRRVQRLPHIRKVREIGLHGGRRAGAREAFWRRAGRRRVHFRTVLDEAVVVGLFDPLVDDAAGPCVCHVAEEGVLVGEGTGTGLLATGFGHEDGDVERRTVLLEHVVAGGHVAGVAAP